MVSKKAKFKSTEKINLSEKLESIHEFYVPRIAGELNGQYVKLVKFKGPYVWHRHEREDELFLVVKGRFDLEYRDGTMALREGEFVIVPGGVEHRPNAREEAHVLLFEPATTINTGDEKECRFTIKPEELERI